MNNIDEAEDVIRLNIDNNVIECNRSVLIENSDYFRAMFDGNFAESRKTTITINGVETDAMKTILKLIWDPDYPMDESLLCSVLQASSMLQFLQIQLKCINELQQILTKDNCLKLWFFTERLNLRELYSNAKLYSLLNFMYIKDTEDFLKLTEKQLITYIGNIHLQSQQEVYVLDAIIRWLIGNMQNIGRETIPNLLLCVNFNAIDHNELQKVIQTAATTLNQDIFDILNNSCKDVVNKGSKQRNLDGFICILLENCSFDHSSSNNVAFQDQFKRKRTYSIFRELKTCDYCIACFDSKKMKFRTISEFGNEKFANLDGFCVIGHEDNVYTCGGEYSLGKGDWNQAISYFNLTRKQEKQLPPLPFVRRHFSTCVSSKRFYILGGTSRFRLIQENFFWFDFSTNQWSLEHKLPCSRQIKCCNYKQRLFLLNINNKCGYLYSHDENSWCRFDIADANNLLPPYSDAISLFSYKDHLYIKDEKLFRLKVTANKRLEIVNEIKLARQPNKIYQSESIVCNNFLYSVNKHRCDITNDETMSFEAFDIDLGKIVYRFEKSIKEQINVDNSDWRLKSSLNIFNVFLPELIVENDMMNEELKDLV